MNFNGFNYILKLQIQNPHIFHTLVNLLNFEHLSSLAIFSGFR
jgi:hypothetical protein